MVFKIARNCCFFATIFAHIIFHSSCTWISKGWPWTCVIQKRTALQRHVSFSDNAHANTSEHHLKENIVLQWYRSYKDILMIMLAGVLFKREQFFNLFWSLTLVHHLSYYTLTRDIWLFLSQALFAGSIPEIIDIVKMFPKYNGSYVNDRGRRHVTLTNQFLNYSYPHPPDILHLNLVYYVYNFTFTSMVSK